MKKRIFSLLLALVMALSLLPTVAFAAGNTLYVGGDGQDHYADLATAVTKATAGDTIELLQYRNGDENYNFTKADDGFCYVDAANKTGRLVWLDIAAAGNTTTETTFYVNGGTTAKPIQTILLDSASRLEKGNSGFLMSGDIVILPAGNLYMSTGSTIDDVYGDITFVGAGKDSTTICPLIGGTAYRFFRLYNRYTKNIEDDVVYHYSFKNLTFDGQYATTTGALNLFVVTCYNIDISMDTVDVKNFKGSVFSVWANDTLNDEQYSGDHTGFTQGSNGYYPTKAMKSGVTINLKNVTTNDNGKLIHFDCSPYQARDLDAGLDCYAYIHLNYDGTCSFNDQAGVAGNHVFTDPNHPNYAPATFSVNGSTAYCQNNCLINGVDVLPPVAQITKNNVTTGYATLAAAAVAAAGDKDVIELVKDVTIASAITLDKNLTIDLNSKTITSSIAAPLQVAGANDVTIKNGTITGPSGSTGAALDGKAVVQVRGSGAKLTLTDVTITAGGVGSDGMYGVYVLDGASLTANNANIHSHFAAIGTNFTTATANITINGGTYTADAAATNNESWSYFCAPIYAACSGKLTINSGTFNGFYGLSTRYKDATLNLEIKDGIFNGNTAALFVDVQNGNSNSAAEVNNRTISITGGTFSSNPSDYVAKGYAVTKDGKLYTVATAENTAAVDVTNDGGAVTVANIVVNEEANTNTIDVKSFGAESITADKTTLSEVINNTATTKPVEFVLDTDTSVKFNKEAVQAIAVKMAAATGDITLVVKPNETVAGGESTAMNTVAAGNANAKVVKLELMQGATKLFEGSAGAEATVTVPFTMPAGCNRVNVYYLNPTGTAEYVGTASTANEAATFTVKHFSSYALVPTYVGGSYTPSAAQTITTDLPAGSITKVTVDGKTVDSKYYTISGGNVTLTDAYIKTLSNGKHTVAIENATHISKATITVNNAANAATVKSGKTGDAGILLYGALALMSVTGSAVIIGKKKEF